MIRLDNTPVSRRARGVALALFAALSLAGSSTVASAAAATTPAAAPPATQAAGSAATAPPNPLANTAAAAKSTDAGAALPAVIAPRLTPLPQVAGSPTPPGVDAAAWTLVDTLSGTIIASSNADARRAPASLTKLMTAYLVFQALRAKSITLAQEVPVSENAWRTGGSRMFIEPKK